MECTITARLKCMSRADLAFRSRGILTRLGFVLFLQDNYFEGVLFVFHSGANMQPYSEIAFDSNGKGVCQSMLALAFSMRRFPNDALSFQGVSPCFLQMLGDPRGPGMCGTQPPDRTVRGGKRKGAATPKDLYRVMNRVKELGFSLL